MKNDKKRIMINPHLEVEGTKGCGVFLHTMGNLDIWCGFNSCNGKRLPDNHIVIKYCINCDNMIAIDKETNTKFDDWVELETEEFDTDTWTQVCDSCAKKHHLLDSYLDINAGHGICGVEGCNNISDHYYAFIRKGNINEKI